MIFSSIASAKQGNEDVILENGSFLQFYDDVLVHKTLHNSWIHRVEIEVPNKSFLQLTLITDQPHKFRVKLLNFAGTSVLPIHKDLVHTASGNLQELSVVFLLEKYQTYYLTL